MTESRPTPGERFRREGGRHRFTARRAQVVTVSRPAPVMIRVRVGGPDFHDFVSTGPADHMRVFFPDPQTGELNAPVAAGPDEDGIVRPEGQTFARDFTPLRSGLGEDGPWVDLDVYHHPSPGPAALWADAASLGDGLVIVGPRGSRGAPQDAGRLLLLADETALPAAGRWAREVPPTTAVDVVAVTADDGSWVGDYLAEVSGRDDVRVHRIPGPVGGDELVGAIAGAGGIHDDTYVFAAGEASALLPLRRHLRGELGLPSNQVTLSGYWRRGVVGFDHHTPIDPDDPD